MPGVLWPKFEDQKVGRHLAYTGAIRDEILDQEDLACSLLLLLAARYPAALSSRYRLEPVELEGTDGYGLLCLVAKKRGMLLPGVPNCVQFVPLS